MPGGNEKGERIAVTKEKGFRHEEEAVLLLNKGKQGVVHMVLTIDDEPDSDDLGL